VWDHACQPSDEWLERCARGTQDADPRSTTAPTELVNFLDSLKRLQSRSYDGEFVASDGTRIKVNVTFERERPAAGNTDG
jgi:hypothetical protein